MSALLGSGAPDAAILAIAVALDLAIGDPVYRWHPVRLMGASLSWLEARLRECSLDGYGGGVLLFVLLTGGALLILSGLVDVAWRIAPALGWAVSLYFVYSLLALGDLLRHVWRIEQAVRDGDMARARAAVGALVGRDTDRLDEAGCRRAGVESLSESLTDGFVSPIFWYVLLGLPGLVLFKVVSTMDSMVGYKTPRYLEFGWCGARLDDAMNYVPARLTWLVMSAIAWAMPQLSGPKAWHIGLSQHAVVPGPNAGWSEAAAAGALSRRIIGPIWRSGELVTSVWIGAAEDPPLATADDVQRAVALVVLAGLAVTALGVMVLAA